jgi:tRNA(Ile2) C34 agmatinyltransferase TiaS
MFNIEERHIVSEQEKLLFNIQELMKNILIKLNKEVSKPELIKVEDENKPNQTLCKYCGGTHENKGQMLSCAKKNKKER